MKNTEGYDPYTGGFRNSKQARHGGGISIKISGILTQYSARFDTQKSTNQAHSDPDQDFQD